MRPKIVLSVLAAVGAVVACSVFLLSSENEMSSEDRNQEVVRDVGKAPLRAQSTKNRLSSLRRLAKLFALPLKPTDEGETQEEAVPWWDDKWCKANLVACDSAKDEDFILKMDEYLSNEPEDSDWVGEVTTLVYQGLEREEFSGSHLMDMKCAATLCKLQFVHEAEWDLVTLRRGMRRTAPYNEGRRFTKPYYGSDGQVRTTVFFTRERRPYPVNWGHPG